MNKSGIFIFVLIFLIFQAQSSLPFDLNPYLVLNNNTIYAWDGTLIILIPSVIKISPD